MKAFQQLKSALASAHAYLMPGVSFILDTDASNYAVVAVQSQVQEGKERVIAYYSQALTKPKIQYCVTRRELLSIVRAIKHSLPVWDTIQHSNRLLSHCSAPCWLHNFWEPEGLIAQWIQKLQEYSFSTEYRAGTLTYFMAYQLKNAMNIHLLMLTSYFKPWMILTILHGLLETGT